MTKIKNKKNSLAAFTLIEVLVALMIFSVVLTGVSGIFGNFVKNYTASKQIQKNLENVQYAMNSMAKTLRTSAILDPLISSDGDYIIVYDYSQAKCIKFAFMPGNGLRKYSEDPVTLGDPNTCHIEPQLIGNPQDLIYATSGVTTVGRFTFRIPSNNSDPNYRVGMITASVNVKFGADESRLQTTVSLRDYQNTK